MRGEKAEAYGEEFSPLERVNVILSSLNKSFIKSYAEIFRTIKSVMHSIIKFRQYILQLSMLRLPIKYFSPIFRESMWFEEFPIFYLESIKFLFPSRHVLLDRALLNVFKSFRSQMVGSAGLISPGIILSSLKLRGALGASRLLFRGVVRFSVMRGMISRVSRISPQIVESDFLRRVEGASLVKEVARYPKKIDFDEFLVPSLLSVERLVDMSSRGVEKIFSRQLKLLKKSLRDVQVLLSPFPKILEKILIETVGFAFKYHTKPSIFVPRVLDFKSTRLLKLSTLLTSFHHPLMKSFSDLSAFILAVREDFSRIGRMIFSRFIYDFHERVEGKYFERLKILQGKLVEVSFGDKLFSRFPLFFEVEFESLKRLYSDLHEWSITPFMSRVFVEKVPSVSSLPRRVAGEVKVTPIFRVKPLGLFSKYYEFSRGMLLKGVDVFTSPKIQRSLGMMATFDLFSRVMRGVVVSLLSIYRELAPSYRLTRPIIGYGLRSKLGFIYDVFADFQRRVSTYNVEKILINLISHALPMGKLVFSQLIKRGVVEVAKFIPERYDIGKLSLRPSITPLTVVSPVRFQEVVPMLSLMRAPTVKTREPRVLRPLNITVKVESLRDERDLRELERKIAKILREAARKYGVVL